VGGKLEESDRRAKPLIAQAVKLRLDFGTMRGLFLSVERVIFFHKLEIVGLGSKRTTVAERQFPVSDNYVARVEGFDTQ